VFPAGDETRGASGPQQRTPAADGSADPARECAAPGTGHTIAVLHVHHILLGARRKGCDIAALLSRAGISEALLHSPSARVTQRQYAALMRCLRRVLRDEFWGLLGQPVPPGVFRQVCESMVHCGTLQQAIDTALRQYRLHIPDFAARLQVRDGMASLMLVRRAAPSPCLLFAESCFAFQGYGVVSWLLARSLPLARVDLASPPPGRQTDTARVFGAEVRYGQAHTALHFDAAWLRLPLAQDTNSLAGFLRDAPHKLLVRYRDDSCLAERIRRHLRVHLDTELPSLEQMAETLRLTPQTLRRRLRDEGGGYQRIKDDLRRDAAIGLLERSGLPLQEVALRLGFSEPSTFHRAFKKWTGVAPGEYRQRQMRGLAG
jgi:AraC-like DNA-binding protein